jgi:hypothetical protein
MSFLEEWNHFLQAAPNVGEPWVKALAFAEEVLNTDKNKLRMLVGNYEPYLRSLGPIAPVNSERFAIRFLLWLSKELPLKAIPSFACYVIFLLQPGRYRLVDYTSAFTELCALVGYLARVSDEACECLDEYQLFSKIATRFGESPSSVSYCVCPFVEKNCMWAPTTLVLPVSNWVCCNYDREDFQVKLLMSSFPLTFLPLMIPSLVVLVQRMRRWGIVDWSSVLAACLRGPSVELVLHLHVANALQPLVHRCEVEAPTSKTWQEVKSHLERHWPECLGEAPSSLVPTQSALECPITMCPIHHAVVASDGHVYERDALLKHMCKDMRSPFTRDKLSYNLFPLFFTPSCEPPPEGAPMHPPW